MLMKRSHSYQKSLKPFYTRSTKNFYPKLNPPTSENTKTNSFQSQVPQDALGFEPLKGILPLKSKWMITKKSMSLPRDGSPLQSLILRIFLPGERLKR